MADERDPELSKHYRELEPLEPPAELDRKILASARATHSARRWYYSLAAAAVLVFAVAITLQMERERPDTEAVSPPVRGEIKPAPKPEPPPVFAPDPQAKAVPEPRAAAAPSPRADERRAQPERLLSEQRAEGAAASERSAGSLARSAPPEKPESWLERIAELRSRGRHAEADRELAAFRRAYPDYQLSEVMRERVEGIVAPR